MSVPHPQNRIIFAPQPYKSQGEKSVFLAGSIDQGSATWRETISTRLSARPITILNPHRRDWDSSWVEDISHAPFREQVEWELNMQESADVVALYFAPASQAPISLLELGLFARTGKVFVVCPKGFWKRGNVQIVCSRFGLELLETLDELVQAVETRLGELDR